MGRYQVLILLWVIVGASALDAPSIYSAELNRNAATVEVISEVAEGLYFQEVGQVAGSIGYGHLVLDVNLTSIRDMLERLCEQPMIIATPGGVNWGPKKNEQWARHLIQKALIRECDGYLTDFHQHVEIWLSASALGHPDATVRMDAHSKPHEKWAAYHQRRKHMVGRNFKRPNELSDEDLRNLPAVAIPARVSPPPVARGIMSDETRPEESFEDYQEDLRNMLGMHDEVWTSDWSDESSLERIYGGTSTSIRPPERVPGVTPVSNSTELVRQERQVVVGLLLAGVVAIASSLFTWFQMGHLSNQVSTGAMLNVEILEAHESRITADERSVMMLREVQEHVLEASVRWQENYPTCNSR